MDILNLEKLQLFLVIVLPGFVAIKVFDLFSPPEKRDFGASLIEAAVYGLLNFGLWAWYIVDVNLETARAAPGRYSVMFFVICVLTPAALALAASLIRRTETVCKWMGHPSKSAWDNFFTRRAQCWVICHLKSGKTIQGWFGPDSYATVYPNKPELYVQLTYYADENGKIMGDVPGSFGFLVRHEDCHLIEFLKVERPNA